MVITDEQLIALAKATDVLANIIVESKREDVPSMSYGYYQFDMRGSFLLDTTIMAQLTEAIKVSNKILHNIDLLQNEAIKKLTPETRRIKAQIIVEK